MSQIKQQVAWSASTLLPSCRKTMVHSNAMKHDTLGGTIINSISTNIKWLK